MNEEQQRLWSLLQDALPNVATQMRGSLSNLYTAVGRLLPPEELEQQPELTQSAAILNQSYYRLLRMVNNLSALAILKEHTPFLTVNVHCFDRGDQVFHFHTIGTDILHGTRSHFTGNKGEIFRSIPAMLYTISYKIIPNHACSYPHGYTPFILFRHLDPFDAGM